MQKPHYTPENPNPQIEALLQAIRDADEAGTLDMATLATIAAQHNAIAVPGKPPTDDQDQSPSPEFSPA